MDLASNFFTAHSEWQWNAESSVFGTVSLWFFVCLWNSLETAEQICAKFTQKMCLVPSQGTKNGIFAAFGGLHAVYVW